MQPLARGLSLAALVERGAKLRKLVIGQLPKLGHPGVLPRLALRSLCLLRCNILRRTLLLDLLVPCDVRFSTLPRGRTTCSQRSRSATHRQRPDSGCTHRFTNPVHQ